MHEGGGMARELRGALHADAVLPLPETHPTDGAGAGEDEIGKESADALKSAFAQSGFEAGGFTVAYSSAGTGGSFSGSETGGGFADARHAERYEDAFASEGSAVSGESCIAGEHAVNVIV